MKHEHTFICGTSIRDDMEIVASEPEEAAIAYVKAVLPDHGGEFASVWVGRAWNGELTGPEARTCYTIMIPGACPFETEQFRAFVRWYMAATGVSGDLAWNRAIWLICRSDMGYEELPGMVPITLSEKETVCCQFMTFEWKLAGYP